MKKGFSRFLKSVSKYGISLISSRNSLKFSRI